MAHRNEVGMPHESSAPQGGIVIAHGYGLKVYVQRGHLVVHYGVGRQRQTHRFNRATGKLKRVLVIGHTGFVTLEALRWLRDTGAALVHLDADGQLLTTSAPGGSDQAALRRAQALAAGSPVGVEIARSILDAKVAGQLALLHELPDGDTRLDVVRHALSKIQGAEQLTELLAAEAQGADAYWDGWAGLTIPFPAAARSRVPEHWQVFGQRASLLTNGPRLASNPSGAILNYLYALLEAETILACHTVGLDPGIGIFHVDRRDRASMALDIMEAARTTVDAYLLALLTQRTLAPTDFIETRRGACRLKPSLAAQLAQTTNVWAHHVAPIVEQTAHTLARASPSRLTLTTPLTRANHRPSNGVSAPRRARQANGTTPVLPASCRDCGTPLPNRRRRYCDPCKTRRFAKTGPRARQTAAGVLAKLRAEQSDPAHGGLAGQIRGRKNSAHQQAVRAWAGPQPDPETFKTQILPGLQQTPISELVAATGLSSHYCSLIRLGKRVPHPRHWEALKIPALPTPTNHRDPPVLEASTVFADH
jgi:CRISPR-associated endonuclease Cas1